MRTTLLGASFSLHRSNELGLDSKTVLKAALEELGLQRFRLMSYWNIHEAKPGIYDFSELDWQLDMIAKYGGQVTLALGVRQPRWPEWHMPDWAAKLSANEWYEALYKYIEMVVLRYKDHPALASWQLENEALLKTFGTATDFNRTRLKHECRLVKQLDPNHPLIMTLSDSWGIPWLGPRPDSYGMSLYRATLNSSGRYNQSHRPAWFYRLRRGLIWAYTLKHTFIHELQAEPWVDKALLDVPVFQQLERMNAEKLVENFHYAQRTGASPIDLWGLEWWYWLKTQQHPELWQSVNTLVLALHP